MSHPYRLFSAALLVLVFNFAAAAPQAKDVFPMRQGIHEFSAGNGKLIMVVGSYQDTTTFRRSYNFYFVPKGDDAWNQVPLVRKPDDIEFTSTSAGAGDETVSDGLAVKHGNNVYFVLASKRAGKGAQEKSNVTVTWFQFVEAPDSEPDGPAYALKPVFTRMYGTATKLNVDAILRKESSLKPSK